MKHQDSTKVKLEQKNILEATDILIEHSYGIIIEPKVEDEKYLSKNDSLQPVHSLEMYKIDIKSEYEDIFKNEDVNKNENFCNEEKVKDEMDLDDVINFEVIDSDNIVKTEQTVEKFSECQDPLDVSNITDFLEDFTNNSPVEGLTCKKIINNVPISMDFVCNICNKNCYSYSKLEKHIDIHKTHRCLICMKKFFKLDHLIRHKRYHTQDKPFSCSICDKKFVFWSCCKRHERSHENKKYICLFCSKTFRNKSNLLRHQLVHSVPNLRDTFDKRLKILSHMEYENSQNVEEPHKFDEELMITDGLQRFSKLDKCVNDNKAFANIRKTICGHEEQISTHLIDMKVPYSKASLQQVDIGQKQSKCIGDKNIGIPKTDKRKECSVEEQIPYNLSHNREQIVKNASSQQLISIVPKQNESNIGNKCIASLGIDKREGQSFKEQVLYYLINNREHIAKKDSPQQLVHIVPKQNEFNIANKCIASVGIGKRVEHTPEEQKTYYLIYNKEHIVKKALQQQLVNANQKKINADIGNNSIANPNNGKVNEWSLEEQIPSHLIISKKFATALPQSNSTQKKCDDQKLANPKINNENDCTLEEQIPYHLICNKELIVKALQQYPLVGTTKKKYQCGVCFTKLANPSIYEKHICIPKEKIPTHLQSNEKFITESLLQLPVHTAHKLHEYKTQGYGNEKEFISEKDRRTVHTGQKQYACGVSDDKLNNPSFCEKHESTLKKQIPFHFKSNKELITKSLQHKTVYTAHKWNDNSRRKKCTMEEDLIFNKEEIAMQDLQQSVHTEQIQYECGVCFEKFANPRIRERHQCSAIIQAPPRLRINKQLYAEFLQQPVHTAQKVNECTVSDKILSNNDTRKECTDEKDLICNKEIIDKVELEDFYECSICRKRFWNPDPSKKHKCRPNNQLPARWRSNKELVAKTLVQHPLVHTAQKRYECEDCHVRFTEENHLTLHRYIYSSGNCKKVNIVKLF